MFSHTFADFADLVTSLKNHPERFESKKNLARVGDPQKSLADYAENA
jgi:hypothetical protein